MKPKKEIIFGEQAHQKLLKGMEVLYKAVSSTLGPRSHNVAINNPWNTPEVYRDGVTVARRINIIDSFEDMGAELLKSASVKTVEKVGDGTTTATILTYAIVEEAFKMIAGGVKSMELKEQLESASQTVTKNILALAKKIDKKEDIQSVAKISASSEEIGDTLSEIIEKVGKDAPITTEIGKKTTTYVEYMQGLEFDRGFLNQQFMTDEKRSEAVMENPYILVTDKNISYTTDIVPFIQKFLATKTDTKNLVIISGNLSDEALAVVTINHLRPEINLNVLPIQAPAWAERRVAELEDIAVFTAGTVILDSSGRTLDSVEISELGRARKIIADVDKTTIIEGAGKPEARITDLQEQIKNAKTDFDRDIKTQRLSKLTGRAAIIYVGAATDTEVKEKRERVIDAIHATKAALEEGIVAGGAVTLLHIANKAVHKGRLNFGERILYEAMKRPFKILMENSGMDYGDAREMMAGSKYPFGIDVIDGQLKDLVDYGVIDPVRVVRLTLENAVSQSMMIFTTDTLISEVEEKE